MEKDNISKLREAIKKSCGGGTIDLIWGSEDIIHLEHHYENLEALDEALDKIREF